MRTIICLCAFCSVLSAAVPRQISYQGILTEPDGTVKPDGRYCFEFELYTGNDVSTGWSQVESLTVNGGLFSTVLGKGDGFEDLAFDEQYFLEVKVNGTSLSQKVGLTSVGYAVRAEVADNAAVASKLSGGLNTFDSIEVAGTAKIGNRLSVSNETESIALSVSSGEKSVYAILNRHDAADEALVDFKTNDSLYWRMGLDNYPAIATNSFSVKRVNNATPDLCIDSIGNVGVGTATPGCRLDVRGQLRLYDRSAMYLSPSDTFDGVIANFIGSESGGDGHLPFVFRTKSQNRMIIGTNGNIGIGIIDPDYALDVNGTIRGDNVAPSDRRYKKNITPIASALDKVSRLEGVSYDWDRESHPGKNFPEGTQIGLIAQQVEDVLPELVRTGTDGYKSLLYDKLTAVLVQAVKELQATIKAQQDEIEQQQRRLELQVHNMESIEKRLQQLELTR